MNTPNVHAGRLERRVRRVRRVGSGQCRGSWLLPFSSFGGTRPWFRLTAFIAGNLRCISWGWSICKSHGTCARGGSKHTMHDQGGVRIATNYAHSFLGRIGKDILVYEGLNALFKATLNALRLEFKTVGKRSRVKSHRPSHQRTPRAGVGGLPVLWHSNNLRHNVQRTWTKVFLGHCRSVHLKRK